MDETKIINSSDIANAFDQYFVNVAENLNSKVPARDMLTPDYFFVNMRHYLILRSVSVENCIGTISNLNKSSSAKMFCL